MRLATIARYGNIGEFINVGSSSLKSPNVNCTSSAGASSRATGVAGAEGGDGNSEADATAKAGSEEHVSPSASAVSDGVAAGDAFCLPSAGAALRFPLRRFFFRHPWSV